MPSDENRSTEDSISRQLADLKSRREEIVKREEAVSQEKREVESVTDKHARA